MYWEHMDSNGTKLQMRREELCISAWLVVARGAHFLAMLVPIAALKPPGVAAAEEEEELDELPETAEERAMGYEVVNLPTLKATAAKWPILPASLEKEVDSITWRKQNQSGKLPIS